MPFIPTTVNVMGQNNVEALFFKYNSGNGGTPAFSTSALRDEIIILQGYWRTTDRDAIKAANPNCKVLCYVNMTRIYTGSLELPYGNAVFGAAQRPAYNSGVVDADAGGNVAKIDVAGFGDDTLDMLLTRFEGTAWDGVFLDDVNHVGDGYLTNSTWRTNMQAVNAIVGPGLTDAGVMNIANLTAAVGQHNLETSGWVENQFQYYDGSLFEHFTVWPDASPQDQIYVDEDFAIVGRQQQAGKMCLVQTHSDNETKARFACAIALLQTTGTAMYSTHIDDHTEGWYANTHDKAVALGAPTGNKFSIGTKQWQRDFEHGNVTANLTTRVGTITVT